MLIMRFSMQREEERQKTNVQIFMRWPWRPCQSVYSKYHKKVFMNKPNCQNKWDAHGARRQLDINIQSENRFSHSCDT